VFGLLNPPMTAREMLAGSLSAVANSMRLREGKGKTMQRVRKIIVRW